MTGRVTAALAAALVAFCALVTASPAAASALPDRAVAEADFVERINALRTGKGLRALEVHPELVSVARSWAAKMAAVDRISHNPNLATDVTSDWNRLGENVGVGMTVASIHDAFIASPSHYRNLVDGTYTFIGVGVVHGSDGAIFTAHQFMQLRRAEVTTTTGAPPPVGLPSITAEPAGSASPAVAASLTPRFLLVLEQLRALDPR